jgi:hypothetical protein
MGVMISAYVSREFGFGLQLSQQQLQKVNESSKSIVNYESNLQ